MWQDALIFTGISAAPPFAITTAVMPYLLKRLKEAGIAGDDVNKSGKPSIPEMGGLAALIGRRRYIFSCLIGTATAL